MSNEPVIIGKAKLYNMDCMELLKATPDKFYDLAIVDPPYGVGGDSIHAGRISKGAGKLKNRALQMHSTAWDIAPTKEYFEQLFRVSKNQIIWGGNYFENMPRTRGYVVWDKCQPWPNFSATEFAWTSFDCPSKLYRFDNRTTDKIHPTQKPISLYEYLLTTFAKGGDKILDTHLGSGSHAIACNNLGFEITACEIEKSYFDSACKRIYQETAQERLFA